MERAHHNHEVVGSIHFTNIKKEKTFLYDDVENWTPGIDQTTLTKTQIHPSLEEVLKWSQELNEINSIINKKWLKKEIQ